MAGDALDEFWAKRLARVCQALSRHGFDAFVASDREEAGKVGRELVRGLAPRTLAFGGSVTAQKAIGIGELVKGLEGIRLIDAYEPQLTPEEAYERRREGLTADIFVCGTNAVTEDGALINLDGTGNRVAAITFGPRSVLIFAGRNKIVDTLDAGIARTRHIAAPANALRLQRGTPCTATGVCCDCSSPDRICNQWGVIARCVPLKRIKVILVNEVLGY